MKVQTDRQTDRPRHSVGNNRLHACVVLRCGLKRYYFTQNNALIRTLDFVVTMSSSFNFVSKKYIRDDKIEC